MNCQAGHYSDEPLGFVRAKSFERSPDGERCGAAASRRTLSGTWSEPGRIRLGAHCTARPAADLRKLCHDRGGELKQIQSARACIRADHGTLSRLQTESRASSERPFRPQNGWAAAGETCGICPGGRGQRSVERHSGKA